MSKLIPICTILTLIVAWHLGGEFGLLDSSTDLPPLIDVIKAGQDWIKEGSFLRDVEASLLRVIPGFLIGCFIGFAIGIATGRLRLLYLTLGPVLHIWRALPAVALVPFLILLLGMTDTSKIVMISLGVFFPVWMSAHEGALQVDPKYLEVAENLDLTKFQVYYRVIIPATIPYVVGGMRAGVGLAYIMMFISEWLGSSNGIGYQLSLAHSITDSSRMIVALAVLGTLAYITDIIYRSLIRIYFPWLEYNEDE